jgi:hypothetical protein
MTTFEEFSEEKISSRKFTDNYEELVDFIEQMRLNALVDCYANGYSWKIEEENSCLDFIDISD